MRIAILDPAAGISGDMTLGALLDAGVEADWLRGLPGRLGFDGVAVRIARVERSGLVATKVSFEIPQDHRTGHAHRHVGQLVALVRHAPVSGWVRERAVRAFELLGEAEAKVHGVEPKRVHLHEVGAVDAVLDIVGSIEGFERLGVEGVFNLPVALGDGWVAAAHGQLPVPAPATLELLEGIEVRRGGPVTGEATTPTGAALLRVLSDGAPPVRWRQVSTHWGAGDRDPAGYPNALRLILGESANEAGQVEVVVTDVDDLSPEYLEPLREALFAAGALDCQGWTTLGKKGRPSFRIETLAPVESVDRVIATLFQHSTTAGVRRWPALRATLVRHQFAVELDEAVRVRIKVWEGAFGTRLKAEYDDVIAAAGRLGRPALEVAREAEQRAQAALGDHRTEEGTTTT